MSARPKTTTVRTWLILGLLLALGLTACAFAPAREEPGARAAPPAGESGTRAAPAGPVARVCGNLPPGPETPPEGAVVVNPKVDSDLHKKTRANPPGTTFWLAPGTHTLGTDQFGQVITKEGNTYIGGPNAVVDGRGVNRYAFTGDAENVTIRSLTVQGFVAPRNEGVVNHNSADGWTIENNTVQNNKGAGLMAGAHQVVRDNCLRDNGQYGMNAYQAEGGITDVVVVGNEIAGNNTDDWESKVPGCGCTGGVKFWAVDGAVVRGNWVHDNHGAGLWADTNNNDFLIENNLIENNDSEAIFYEISYNAIIRDNTIRGNSIIAGKEFARDGDNFPAAAIYISESGGEPRIPARTDKIEIYNNTLENNWSGITLWENADRFCNSPANPTGDCTLLVDDREQCSQPGIADPPLYDDCRWKTQRVDIHDNRFVSDPQVVKCKREFCGRMALLSNYGTFPEWSPYKRTVIQEAITFDQNNRWHDNTYIGRWSFTPYDTGRLLGPDKWQQAPYRQDRGSTFSPAEGR